MSDDDGNDEDDDGDDNDNEYDDDEEEEEEEEEEEDYLGSTLQTSDRAYSAQLLTGIIIIPVLPRPDKHGSYIVGRVIRGKRNHQRRTRKAVEARLWCHLSPSVWTAALHSQPCVGAGLGRRLKSRMSRREFDPTTVRPVACRSANNYATPAGHSLYIFRNVNHHAASAVNITFCIFSEALTVIARRPLTLHFAHFQKR